MRVLLDESLPRPLARLLTSHNVSTVTELRWTGIKNGELLRKAADSFDVLLTADQNIEYAYCTAMTNQEAGALVLKTEDAERTFEVLEE